MTIEPVSMDVVREAVARALGEDRAMEDVSTLCAVPEGLMGRATFLAKSHGVAAGFNLAAEAFRQIDSRVTFKQMVAEGESFEKGAVIAEAHGPVRALLQAERTALNFVQRLSGTATLTRHFVDAVAGTKAVILDTRKTTPGLRDLEKYAVRCGGGTNHRRDLAVMAMLKDNHLEAVLQSGRTLAEVVAQIRREHPGVPVEIEVDRLDQLEDALEGGPEWVLLDNMPPETLREAVRLTQGRAKLEASGGVSLATVRAIAESGVDAVSVGALTHSAGSLDISLDLTSEG